MDYARASQEGGGDRARESEREREREIRRRERARESERKRQYHTVAEWTNRGIKI